MTVLLAAAGRTFLKTFIAALVAYAITFGATEDVNHLPLLLFSVVLAAAAAGITSLQVFVPQLTFSHFIPLPYGAWVDSFVHGFLGSLFVTLPLALTTPDITTKWGLLLPVFVGAVNAGLRALEGSLTLGQFPFIHHGLPAPHVLTVDRGTYYSALHVAVIQAPAVLSSTITSGIEEYSVKPVTTRKTTTVKKPAATVKKKAVAKKPAAKKKPPKG